MFSQPHRRPPGAHLLAVTLALLVAVTGACAPIAQPTAPPAPTATVPRPTNTPSAVPTQAPTAAATAAPTVRPTLAPSGLPPLHPSGARTGIPQLDAVVDAFLANKVEPRRALIRFITTPCTTAQGMGGPPKCAAGEADGTRVEVFPEATTEGTFFRRADIDRTLAFTVTGLYGVYQVPASVFRADYWPAGDYALVFAGPGDPASTVSPVIQTIVYVTDGAVVRLRRTPFPEPWPPAESAGATWVLAPVR